MKQLIRVVLTCACVLSFVGGALGQSGPPETQSKERFSRLRNGGPPETQSKERGGSNVDAVKSYKEGLKLYKEKNWSAARKKFESAVFFQPGMEQGFYCLGLCHLLQGNIREAIRCERRLVELRSHLTERLAGATDKRLPEGNAGRAPGHLPRNMDRLTADGVNDEEVGDLETPTNEGAAAKFDESLERGLKEREQHPDDPDCRASRQLVADGILAFFEKNSRKTSICNADIKAMIKRAGEEKEDDDEQEGRRLVGYSMLRGKRVPMYKGGVSRLWIEPLISEKLMCPCGGTYVVRQVGRTFTVHCNSHNGPEGTIEAPEQCEPKDSTWYCDFLIPSSY